MEKRISFYAVRSCGKGCDDVDWIHLAQDWDSRGLLWTRWWNL